MDSASATIIVILVLVVGAIFAYGLFLEKGGTEVVNVVPPVVPTAAPVAVPAAPVVITPPEVPVIPPPSVMAGAT